MYLMELNKAGTNVVQHNVRNVGASSIQRLQATRVSAFDFRRMETYLTYDGCRPKPRFTQPSSTYARVAHTLQQVQELFD